MKRCNSNAVYGRGKFSVNYQRTAILPFFASEIYSSTTAYETSQPETYYKLLFKPLNITRIFGIKKGDQFKFMLIFLSRLETRDSRLETPRDSRYSSPRPEGRAPSLEPKGRNPQPLQYVDQLSRGTFPVRSSCFISGYCETVPVVSIVSQTKQRIQRGIQKVKFLNAHDIGSWREVVNHCRSHFEVRIIEE